MKTFKEYQPGQALLFPVDLNEWLPKGHPAHFVNVVAGQLDLSGIYASYDELRGSPPYDPRMMVRVWVYALMKGVRSSRKIERALYGAGPEASAPKPNWSKRPGRGLIRLLYLLENPSSSPRT
jgi:transposase